MNFVTVKASYPTKCELKSAHNRSPNCTGVDNGDIGVFSADGGGGLVFSVQEHGSDIYYLHGVYFVSPKIDANSC